MCHWITPFLDWYWVDITQKGARVDITRDGIKKKNLVVSCSAFLMYMEIKRNNLATSWSSLNCRNTFFELWVWCEVRCFWNCIPSKGSYSSMKESILVYKVGSYLFLITCCLAIEIETISHNERMCDNLQCSLNKKKSYLWMRFLNQLHCNYVC